MTEQYQAPPPQPDRTPSIARVETRENSSPQGDSVGGIETFALRYGAKRVALGATIALGLNYVGAIATPLLASAGAFHTRVMVRHRILQNRVVTYELPDHSPTRSLAHSLTHLPKYGNSLTR